MSEAFTADPGKLPSPRTVTALAAVLKLQDTELLELLRESGAAAGEAGLQEQERSGAVGRPIAQWNPHDLEVHPAADTPAAGGVRATLRRGSGTGASVAVLPGYVRRPHDAILSEAVAEAAVGDSAMVILVGSSSTGKTRACWEAVQPLRPAGWRLWHPFDPTRAEAALEDLGRVRPKTVVWLNEAQHYLGDTRYGERIAAHLHELLTRPDRGPVLVLGTLWPQYERTYTTTPDPEGPDPHSRVRELLAGRLVTVPEAFDEVALSEAVALAEAGDRHLSDALARVEGGRLTQDLAGAPELLRRYRNATPGARALLRAAMDARRLGAGPHLPVVLLTEAAQDYLSDDELDALTDDWAEQVLAELARPVHGNQAPLRRVRHRADRHPPSSWTPSRPAPVGPLYRLADYLEQHGRTERRSLCPPASFWHAVSTHLTHPEDLGNLAAAAESRYRLQWAEHLYRRAARAGNTRALMALAEMRIEARDHEGAERIYWQAANAGKAAALVELAKLRSRMGDEEGAERLGRQAADAGDTRALYRLVELRERAVDGEGAERLARQLADTGDTSALYRLAELRERALDGEGAERLARQAADAGDTSALTRLAEMRGLRREWESAERAYRQAADAGDTSAQTRLTEMRGLRREWESAERTYQAVDAGNTAARVESAERRSADDEENTAERFSRPVGDADSSRTVTEFADRRQLMGNREEAEHLARRATDAGKTDTLIGLALRRERAGDRAGAEQLYRQAADAGDTQIPGRRNRWPYGLDPDGSPTSSW